MFVLVGCGRVATDGTGLCWCYGCGNAGNRQDGFVLVLWLRRSRQQTGRACVGVMVATESATDRTEVLCLMVQI